MSVRTNGCAVLGALLMLATAAACNPTKPLHRFKIVVSTFDDDGEILGGVRVGVNGDEVGVTGDEGGLAIKILAREGRVVRLRTGCPKGYRSSPTPKLLKLHAFERQERVNTLRVTATCKPRTRTAAVLVRAPGWANLPVLRRGKVIGQTDANGVAHILLAKMSPKTRFQLTIDTTSRPRLRPINPSASFALEDADRLFTFEQRFEELAKPKKKRKKRKAKPLKPMPEVMESIYTPKWKLEQIERNKEKRDKARRERLKRR